MTSLCYGTPGDISEFAAEAFHSLKYLVPKDFLAEQRIELTAFRQTEAIQHFQSSQARGLFIISWSHQS